MDQNATTSGSGGARVSRGGREKRVALLGSTGSIGTQTIEVIRHLNALAERDEAMPRYRVVGLAAGRNCAKLLEQAGEFPGAKLALADEECDAALVAKLPRGSFRGATAALGLVQYLCERGEVDLVLGAMVGSSGLPATMMALERGVDVALANKETLVAAGALVVPAALKTGAALLPVDSEHSGVWQAMAGLEGASPPFRTFPATVARIVLTASGGPFRTWERERIYHATVREALNHPTWSMGPKVTIDSASLTNKALEVIEAHWLFAAPAERIGVLVHPQSIVHALVEAADGSVIAQMGSPDMRCPIQVALSWPRRVEGACRRVDFAKMTKLEFAEPDLERFPALGLAYDVIRMGGTAGAVFNAANEAAVEAFLAQEKTGRAMPFGKITEVTAAALKSIGSSGLRSFEDVMEADGEARRFVAKTLDGDQARSRAVAAM